MLAIMCRDQGVGLAAPQVGVNVRLMVYNPEGEKGKGQEWILVNPRVISSGKGQDIMEEGCLSFQDISKDMYIKGRVIVSLSICLPRVCYLLEFASHAKQIEVAVVVPCDGINVGHECSLCLEHAATHLYSLCYRGQLQ